jgi:hypothetical protein
MQQQRSGVVEELEAKHTSSMAGWPLLQLQLATMQPLLSLYYYEESNTAAARSAYLSAHMA